MQADTVTGLPFTTIQRTAEARVPTRWGQFTCYAYQSLPDDEAHLAFVMGEPRGRDDVLVRVHSECLTGDVFGSLRCDCGHQLSSAMATIAAEGLGVVVYLRGHEGRGILPVDSREYGIGAQILVDLGVTTMRLMTNNPAKRGGLEGFGLEIADLVPIEAAPNPENIRYLLTKRERMGHLLNGLDEVD